MLAEKGPGRVSPHFVHGRLINLISGQVSIKYGLMGPNHAVVTACSTGAHSIGDAARMIRDGEAGVVLAHSEAHRAAAVVRTLVDDPATRDRMGASGRALAERQFDIEAIADRFETVIRAARS